MLTLASNLESLFIEFARCTKCPDGSEEIRGLAQNGRFRYKWNPMLRGEPPYRYVLFAMEPSLGSKSDMSNPKVDEGGFHPALRFAVESFLVGPPFIAGYYISNVAKCNIPAGSCADRTRRYRFENCKRFIRDEISLAAGNLNDALVVAIGVAPLSFLSAALPGKPIHKVLHYSVRNSWRFNRFAAAKASSYNEFRLRISPEFYKFLERPSERHDLSWGQHHQKECFVRLFKWQQEMRAIKSSP